MRISITCESCGERHRLERPITRPGPIWVICHCCEMPLQAVFDGPIPEETEAVSVWSTILDMKVQA